MSEDTPNTVVEQNYEDITAFVMLLNYYSKITSETQEDKLYIIDTKADTRGIILL